MAIYTDCNGELVGELFRTEIICGSMWYLSNSIQNDHHHSHGNYQFLWAKILLIQEITPFPLYPTILLSVTRAHPRAYNFYCVPSPMHFGI